MSIGVITHLVNPTFADVHRLAREAEAAGADWLGLPDAFWWRDAWLLLAEAARATERIQIGPLVTNPYLRHPFHTLSALASLQELAGPRVFLGLGAGGSEVWGAARVSRRDPGAHIEAVVALLRGVVSGQPLDAASGRKLEIHLASLPVLIAGRGDQVLRAAGACADRALLWAVPSSDLERSASLIKAAGAPELIWAPLVDHGAGSRERVRAIAAYSVLNSHPSVQTRWGLSRSNVAQLRHRLVGGGATGAQDLVPAVALEDLIVQDSSTSAVASVAHSIGATSLALPAFSVEEVEQRVTWARLVLAEVAERAPMSSV